MRPVIARISVVLPAPFGPSRPVTPGPNEQLSSDSATFCRNHTDTLSTVTVASSTNAGSSAGSVRVSSFHPAVATQQHRGPDEQHRDVDDDREQPAVAHAAERRPRIDVAEEHEVAQVQRQRAAR